MSNDKLAKSPWVVDTTPYQDPMSIRMMEDLNKALDARFEERLSIEIKGRDMIIQMLVDAWHTADGGHDMHKAIACAESFGYRHGNP